LTKIFFALVDEVVGGDAELYLLAVTVVRRAG